MDLLRELQANPQPRSKDRILYPASKMFMHHLLEGKVLDLAHST
jgi:hypothetical protein